jgi:hypothetical protein
VVTVGTGSAAEVSVRLTASRTMAAQPSRARGGADGLGDEMRIRRGLLFWGVFLILLGGIPLLVRAGILDGAVFVDAWRLWPLILIGIGLAILVGHRRAGATVTVILAIALGVVAGGALAAGNIAGLYAGDCVATQAPMEHVTQSGTLETPAAVRLEMDCGEVEVTTTASSSWSLNADHRGAPPVVTASGSSLLVAAPNQTGPHRQVWMVGLPAEPTRDLDLTANAAASTFDLSGMALDRFRAEINAGDLRVDGSEAQIGRLEISINAGRARVSLGAGPTLGSLSANAGAIDLCVPADAALVLRVPAQLTFAHNLASRGLSQDGDTWRRAGAGGDTIDLIINGNAAGFALDPDGGC